MLVIFLILLTKVLADSEEDKYVDLLPDEEKQQFIDKVARRILKDVESQENGAELLSGEMPDEQLKQHSEFVKAILKQESKNLRKKEGEAVQESSGEDIGVKPLVRTSLADVPGNDHGDYSLRNPHTTTSKDNSGNYIKVEIVTENMPIIKRSVKVDKDKQSSESEENTSVEHKKADVTEKTVKVETTPETKSIKEAELEGNTDVSSDLDKSKNETKQETSFESKETDKNKDKKSSESEENTSVENKEADVTEQSENVKTTPETTSIKKTELEKNTDVSSDLDKSKNESKQETSNESKETDKNKDKKSSESEENTSVENKEADVNEQSENVKTTPETESIKKTELEKNTDVLSDLDKSKNETKQDTSNESKKTDKYKEVELSESQIKIKENDEVEPVNSKDSGSDERKIDDKEKEETLPRKTNNKTNNSDEKSSENGAPTSAVKYFGVKSVENNSDENDNNNNAEEELSTANPAQSTTVSITIDSTSTDILTTFGTTQVSVNQDENNKLDEGYTNKSENNETEKSTTKNTLTSTLSDEGTTESATKTTVYTETTTADSETTVLYTTESPPESTFTPDIANKMGIIVEDFTSAPIPTTTTTSPKLLKKEIPKKPVVIQDTLKSEKITTGHNRGSISKNSIVIMQKHAKYIVSPKASQSEAATQFKHFIDLGKFYYNNKKKAYKKRKRYHVYEIPADQVPFLRQKDPMVDQPHYVPVYNYSPNNAYYNPQNRRGPNPEDSSVETVPVSALNYDDISDDNGENSVEEFYNAAFDKRKQFSNKEKQSQNIFKKQINPLDYIDSDYYSGKNNIVKRRGHNINHKANKFPNSNENSHPAHSIPEGSLKGHVRAVRKILFHQKSFGVLDKDKYGTESIELSASNIKKLNNVPQKKNILRFGSNDNGIQSIGIKDIKTPKENIAIDYYLGRELPPVMAADGKKIENATAHFQKVGYLKNKNVTKELYVMDDFFKQNVEQYLKEQTAKKDNNSEIVANSAESSKSNVKQEENKSKYFDKHEKGLDEPYKKSEQLIRIEALKLKDAVETNATNSFALGSIGNLIINNRRNNAVKVGVYLQVLNDMVSVDSNALKRFDWLGSTVDIHSALQKLYELIAQAVNKEPIHPSDIEILKYTLFLHKLATQIIEANTLGVQQRKKKPALPKVKKIKSRLLKEGLLNRILVLLKGEERVDDKYADIKNFNQFLMDVEDGLFDLHDAIKNIAKITKFRNQQWYQNLKELYIKTDEKHLLELLLHMTAIRFFTLIEESAKNGLEDNYIEYMKRNRKTAKQTLEEMIFLMQILEEYSRFVN